MDTDDTPKSAADYGNNLAAELLARARARAGLSQSELARNSGVPASVVNTIERGKRQPSLPTLAKLVEGAGLQIHVDLVDSDEHSIASREITKPPDENEEPTSLLFKLLLKCNCGSSASPAELARAKTIFNALDVADSIQSAKRLERLRELS